MTGHPMEILLVEDNPADVRLTREAIVELRQQNRLSVVHDGDEALRFLRREGAFDRAPRPDIIILDLNLPKKDGRELLADIKGDRDLRQLPVVVLTTSRAEEDILHAYELHANCYVIKPTSLEDFRRAIQTINTFFGEIVTLPGRS